ncbi:hypothetical protein R80B4_00150 [Fibrobacteres bacterium R8-0-B4]
MDEYIPTFAEIRAQMAETGKQMEKNAKQLAKIDEIMAENAKKSAEIDARIDKVTAELTRNIDKMREELGNIGNNNGLVAEEIVFHSLEKTLTFAGEKFDYIDHGLVRSRKTPDGKKVTGEYDVLLCNGTSAALIEVKHRVGKKALDRLIDVQLPRFRIVCPQYKDAKIYLGLGGMSFETGIAEEARSLGIATLTLSGDAVEIDDEGVKAW